MRIAVAVTATILSVSAARSADIPAKAVYKSPAAPALSAANWSGFYLGGHVGGGWAQSRGTYDDFGDTGPIDFTASGLLGGAQAGYNWQTGRLVYGVEVDGSWADLDDSRTDLDGDQQRMKTTFLGSARLRTGAAIDNILLYGTIGLGYARSEFSVSGDVPSTAKRDVNGWGVVSGFGAEVALTPHWSVRGEYLYYSINKSEDIPALTTDSSATDFVKVDGIHVARIAANYRFDGATELAAAPAANWSGLYAGVHGGYGVSRMVGVYDEAGDNGAFDIDPRGGLGGLQIGYNVQQGAWVYGLELDGSWSGMSDERTDLEGDTEKLETTGLASLRGRLGIAASNRLYYVTAGWGVGRSKLKVVEAGAPATVTLDSGGAVVGSGVNWAFSPNWSARLEGLTYLFDNKQGIPALTADSDAPDFVRQSTINVIRVGLDYRFGGSN